MTLHARVVRRCSVVMMAGGIALGLASSSAFPQVIKGSKVPLNVKVGLWEMTTEVQMTTPPNIDTAGMTPEQKTRMEAAMKMMQQNAAKPHTTRTCLTKEKLEQGFMEERGESCKHTVLESTTTSYGVKFECGGQRPSSGEWHFVAVTPEMVKGKGTMNIQGGSSNVTSTGKWIGAACGNVK